MLVVNITNQPAHKKIHTDFMDQASFNRIRHSLLSCFNDELHFMDMFPLVEMVVPIGVPHLSDSSSKRVTAELRTMAKSSRFQTSKRFRQKIVTNFLAVQDG